ncbi:hypothetical protein GCM10007964_15580 [Sphaerisporangium melleum]|uniref:DUF433 domain-containing protein n=2 Tax=Sphaerisporangium melleum TaxID=321316 RepID=A0A917QXE2_9ACTN|nr:hypothetical protein GCM10007964_15580 [Sphaerisporangium melleum]
MDHPGLSVPAAVNILLAEALRMEEHPGIAFRTGPSGRRAVTINGPDVWEIIRAVRVTREAEKSASPKEIAEMVTEFSGVTPQQITAAIRYQAAYPEEIDGLIEAAEEADRAVVAAGGPSTGAGEVDRP